MAEAVAEAPELGVAPLGRAAVDALAAAHPQALSGELDAALAKMPAETVGGGVDSLLAEAAAVAWAAAPDWAFSSHADAALSLLPVAELAAERLARALVRREREAC